MALSRSTERAARATGRHSDVSTAKIAPSSPDKRPRIWQKTADQNDRNQRTKSMEAQERRDGKVRPPTGKHAKKRRFKVREGQEESPSEKDETRQNVEKISVHEESTGRGQ